MPQLQDDIKKIIDFELDKQFIIGDLLTVCKIYKIIYDIELENEDEED